MLDPDGWLEAAQALPIGKRRRMGHNCGPGTVLVVDHKDNGWGAWCHRCGEAGWVPHPRENLAQKLERLKSERVADADIASDPRPPLPINSDISTWPRNQRVWLYKAGLSNDKIKELGFYYHERTKRVVMPVFEDGKLVYWQARSQDKDAPKYLNPPIDKPIFRQGAGPVLVLTEDMLSAIKVGTVTEAWCIMGTSVPDDKVRRIIEARKPVRVWLDPDGAGQRGIRKLVPRLRNFGVDAKAIRTDRDPKFHSTEEIRNQLGLDAASPAKNA